MLVSFTFLGQSLNFTSRKYLKVIYSTGQIPASKYNSPSNKRKFSESPLTLGQPLHCHDSNCVAQRGKGLSQGHTMRQQSWVWQPDCLPPRHWSCSKPEEGWLDIDKRFLCWGGIKKQSQIWGCLGIRQIL